MVIVVCKVAQSYIQTVSEEFQCPKERVVCNIKYKLYTVTTIKYGSNPAHGEVYSIQHVMKFVSDLRQVDCFLRVLNFPTIKLHTTI